MVLVQQPLPYGSYFQSPLLSYMAVRCLTRHGAWRSPGDYASILNCLRYGLRLTLLGASRPEWVVLREDGPRPTAQSAILATEALRRIREQWLCRDSTPPTVSSAVSRIFLYVKLVGRRSLLQGQVVWDRALELVSFRHVQLQLTQWRGFVNNLLQRCQRLLHTKLLFGLPGIEQFPRAQQLRDDAFDARPGRNFADHPGNDMHLGPWRNWLLVHVGTHEATASLIRRQADADPASAPSWDANGVKAYMRRVSAFLRQMMVLIHMTSGLPARGPELLGVRWCNTELLRNIFLCEGYVMQLMAYHKLEWQVGSRAVARFLPHEVGNLLVQFIVLVIPLAHILRRQLDAPLALPPRSTDHVSDAGSVTDETEVDAQDAVDRDVGIPLLSTTTPRSAIFGESTEDVESVADDDSDDDDAEEPRHQGPNNTMPPAAAVNSSTDVPRDAFLFLDNGSRPWDSRELSTSMRQETVYALGVGIAIQVWRHLAIAIDRHYLQGVGATAFGNPHNEAQGIDHGPAEHDFHHLQASHTPRVGNTMYGNQAVHGPTLTDIAHHNYLKVSQQWHRIAGLGDGPPPPPPPEADIESSISALVAPAAALDNMTGPSPEELRAALVEHTLDRSANFRSDQQRQALAELVRRDEDNAIILPTGSGKTLLFMLMARMPQLGVTVVILPLIALLNDVAARCRSERVPFSTWTDMHGHSNQPSGSSSPLVLVTVEQAVRTSFCARATRLKVSHLLHRIILDEAHMLLTAGNYRNPLLRLRGLRSVGCAWSVMSATLPERGLLELGHLLLMPNLRYICQSADRPELAYEVMHVDNNASTDYLARAVKEQLQRELQMLAAPSRSRANAGNSGDPASWRAIVYCRSQKQ
jgi:hypothetical protein